MFSVNGTEAHAKWDTDSLSNHKVAAKIGNIQKYEVDIDMRS